MLIKYRTACRALAAAKRVDEVKDIRDVAVAMAAYAKQAKDHDLERNAIAIRMRATLRLGEMMDEQAQTVGLSVGTRGSKMRGARVDDKPTLASQGIDKALAHQARVLVRLARDPEAFERKVAEAQASAGRVFRRTVREVEIAQEREERRARTALGGSVADLCALIASGYRAGVIAADPPWRFETYSERSGRAVTNHYETMSLDEIKALPVAQLAADDCALFLWCTWPHMPSWLPVVEAWGFVYSGLGFDWIKTNAGGEGLHWGNGYATRQNPEPCLFARRGAPLCLDNGVHSVVTAPIRAHSEKPDEVYRRIERLYAAPRLELFARKPRNNWRTWGNELPAYDANVSASFCQRAAAHRPGARRAS